jgi:hypothetical protein
VRITLKRSGGFGGIRTTASLDLSKLPKDKIAEAQALIDAAKFFTLPASIRPDHVQPDRFNFELTIETDDRAHTVSIAEQAASKELRALLAWVQKNLKN